MEELNEIIKNLEQAQYYIEDKYNSCNDMFNFLVDKTAVNEDIYYSAKAFTSIINNIVNKKVEYIKFISAGHTEELNFLQTYDDKYLSNLQNLLLFKNLTEIEFINNLVLDIEELLQFLDATLRRISNRQKDTDKLIQNLQKRLDEFCEKFNEEVEEEDYYEEDFEFDDDEEDNFND